MPHWLKYSILALIFLLLASWPLARQFDTGTIEGSITNGTGPVAGASVEARHGIHGDMFRSVSDQSGFYRLEGLRPGRYNLWITAEGYCSLRIERIPVDRGEVVRRDVRLNRALESFCQADGSGLTMSP